MKQRILSCTALLFSAFLMLTMNSCKEDTILGANVLPIVDTSNVIQVPDTLTILTKTVFDDSMATSLSISGIPIYHALGAVAGTDNIGGRAHAGLYFQVVPPSLGYAFPKTPDSAFLVLPYAGFTWGDTTAGNIQQTINVYEIANTDSIVRDTTYYNFSKTATDAASIGSTSISFSKIKDSVSVLGQNRNPHLRIKLSQAFLTKIITEASKTTSALAAYSDWLQFQRGFYVTADSNQGNALYYFLLNGGTDFSMANIQFFYTDQITGGGDTVKYVSFPFDQTRNAHYNRIRRNFTASKAGALMASTALSDSIIIIQNEPGATLDIKIPNIKNLPKQPIVKAELVITQYKEPNDFSDIYFPSARLFPVRVNAAGGTESIQDRYPLTSSEPLIFMDGLRKDVTINGTTYSQYVLNIPREVQKAIVEQRDTLHLRINGAATFPGAYRLMAAGRNAANADMRLKLRIYYSKI